MKGLGNTYKTFKTIMLSKPPYPTFLGFVNTLKGFNMREYNSESNNVDQAMNFQSKKTKEVLAEVEDIKMTRLRQRSTRT